MRYAIDLDGTLTKQKKITNFSYDYLLNIESDLEMIEAVNELYDEGNTIYIYTARKQNLKQITKIYLDKIGVKYDALVCDKLTAEIYVDDRAMSPEIFHLSRLSKIIRRMLYKK